MFCIQLLRLSLNTAFRNREMAGGDASDEDTRINESLVLKTLMNLVRNIIKQKKS